MMYENITSVMASWTAGIVDDEGCIMLIRQRGGLRRTVNDRLCLKVVNTDPRMLKELQRLWGGRIGACSVYTGRRPAWEWMVFNARALEVLRLIRSYLIVKGEQADVALEFSVGIRGGGRGH